MKKFMIRLKSNVPVEKLEELGFVIEESRNAVWAIKLHDILSKPKNIHQGALIIKLSDDDRRIMFRYEADYLSLDIFDEIQFMRGLYDIEFR